MEYRQGDIERDVKGCSGQDSDIKFVSKLLNDNLLATGGDGVEIRIWDLKKKRCEHTITSDRSGYLGMHFDEKSSRLVTGNFSGTLRIWDMNIPKLRNPEQVSVKDLKDMMRLKSVDFSDCFEKSELFERAKCSGALQAVPCRVTLEGHSGAILGIDTYDNLMISSGHDGVIRAWDFTTGKSRFVMPGHEGSTNAVKFFDQGIHLASVGHDGIVTVHDVEMKKKLLSLGGHVGWIWGMALDPEKPGTLISSSIDRTIRVWDLNAKKCIETITDHPCEVPAVCVDWNHHRLISTSFSGRALVHDTRMWKPITVFEGFKDRCTRIAYDRDIVFIGSIDGTVRGFNFAYGL